jgi:uncharacterized protein YfeS
MMKMIKNTLEGEVQQVFFETWKFSQFHMEDDLAVTFLTYLIKEMSKQLKRKNIARKMMEYLKEIGVNAGAIAASKALGDASIRGKIEKKFEENIITAVNRLKGDFKKLVKNVCKDQKVDRVIFFVDDLDRLQPVRAVELLEILNLFLECEKCVFVLAIDYEVVSKGIKKKYDNMLNESKGRKFFEKIIQVPFKMPTAHYNIPKYVESVLKELGVNGEGYNDYINVIQTSIGCNPRTMKRTFNAFLLLTKVHSVEKQEMDEWEKLLLFICLCMQLSFEDIYNYIVLHIEENDEGTMIDDAFFESISEGKLDEDIDYSDLNEILKESQEYDEKQAREFLRAFGAICVKMQKQEDVVEKLKNVLRMTSITEAGVGGKQKEKQMDAEFSEHTLMEVKEKRYNMIGCEIKWYEIGGERCKQTDGRRKMVDLLRDAITYAYKQDTKKFEKFREEQINTDGKNALKTLFQPERTKAPDNICKIAEGCNISALSNNNQKIKHIISVYEGLGIPLDTIKLAVKFAH